MSWSDEPTPTQLGAFARLVHWVLPTKTIQDAVGFLEEHATRHDVSNELSRVRKLYMSDRLNGENVFDSVIWEGFNDRV